MNFGDCRRKACDRRGLGVDLVSTITGEKDVPAAGFEPTGSPDWLIHEIIAHFSDSRQTIAVSKMTQANESHLNREVATEAFQR